MPTQICFPRFKPLPGEPNPPTIDGFVEPEDFLETGFGATRAVVDTGWNNATRITYVADAAVGAGRPLTVFQCLKDNTGDFIYLSFVVRRDTEFHDNDCIVLVFRPNFPALGAAKDGTERRIDIFPCSTGTGVAAGGNPRDVNYYRWNTAGGGSWQDMGNNPVGNVAIKCRSWALGTNNRNWSVEVKLPTTSAPGNGGANWINLANNFGFYCNVIRLCAGSECSTPTTPFDGNSFQFTFPRANYTTGDGLIQNVSDLNQAPIPLTWLAEAFLGDVPGCSGVAGVKFQSGANSIGVLSGGSIINQIQKASPNTFVARVVNTASTAAQAVNATFRIANWGVGPGDKAKWNLIPATGGTSNPSSGTTVPGGGAPVDLTMQWRLTPAEENLYAHPPTPAKPLDSHQCIWVLLDSVQAVDFAESSMRRNMNLVPLSEHEQAADISGDGYPPPPDGAVDQDMLLIVSQMRRGRLVRKNEKQDFNLRSLERLSTGHAYTRGQEFRDPKGWLGYIPTLARQLVGGLTVIYDWVWITDAYRKTEYELGVGGKRYKIYEPVGAFGHLAEHEGLVSAWEQSITPGPDDAARFERTGADAYRLRIPNGGKVQIFTHLKAKEFRLPWWLWVLALFLLLILWLLGRGMMP